MPTEPPKAEPPKRKLRWFQFSLRSLMIFTVIVALACGWLGSKIEQKRRQRNAAEAILKHGGQVYYDYQRVKGKLKAHSLRGGEPFGPAWLRVILGENFFSEVDCIICLDGLENLREFPHLHTLNLVSSEVTDEGLENVKVLTELRNLNLSDTKVSDAVLEDLRSALPQCYIIVLHHVPAVARKDYPPIRASK